MTFSCIVVLYLCVCVAIICNSGYLTGEVVWFGSIKCYAFCSKRLLGGAGTIKYKSPTMFFKVKRKKPGLRGAMRLMKGSEERRQDAIEACSRGLCRIRKGTPTANEKGGCH